MSFDVIAAACAALSDRLGVPASSTVPEERPAEFCTVERTGGGYRMGRDAPNLAVQLWAGTEAEAYSLALAAREVVAALPQLVPPVCRSEVGGLYSFPDPDSRMWRYQLDAYLVTRP